MTSNRPLIIIGAGGVGVEALWVARRMNDAQIGVQDGDWQFIGFCDDNPSLSGSTVDGLKVLGTCQQFLRNWTGGALFFHCAVGNNRQREKLVKLFEFPGFHAATLVDPSAVVAESAHIGDGSYIGAFTVVAPSAVIGRHVLVNTSVGIGHHSKLGDFAQVCPGARINGGCVVGERAFIGSNASLHPGISIGEGASVGANSFAIRSVKPHFSVMGVPARIMSRPSSDGSDAQR